MESFCGQAVQSNIAPFACDAARQFPNKIIWGGYEFTAGDAVDADTFKAVLLSKTLLDSGSSDKLFALNVLEDPQDTSDANKEGQVGEGSKKVLVEGKPSFTYRVEIGQDQFKRLRKFNNLLVPVWTYDDAFNLWGIKTSGNFGGCVAKLFFSDMRQTTSSTPVSCLVTVSYQSAKSYNDEAYYVGVDLAESEPAGLLDGNLVYVSNSTNVYKIAIRANTAAFNKFINIAEKYNASMVAGQFTAFTGATFATSLAITSVAYDSTLKAMTVTFDSTAYTALSAGAKIKLKWGPVATLDTANIDGIEGQPVILTK